MIVLEEKRQIIPGLMANLASLYAASVARKDTLEETATTVLRETITNPQMISGP